MQDELSLPRENDGRIAVENDHEPARYFQPRTLDAFHRGDKIACRFWRWLHSASSTFTE